MNEIFSCMEIACEVKQHGVACGAPLGNLPGEVVDDIVDVVSIVSREPEELEDDLSGDWCKFALGVVHFGREG